MAGPSLQRHEQSIKLIETQMEEVQAASTQKHEETLLQIVNLASQMAEMGNQFKGLATQMQADRDIVSKQIHGLTEQYQAQVASIQPLLHPQPLPSKITSSSSAGVFSSNTQLSSALQSGNISFPTSSPPIVNHTPITSPITRPYANPHIPPHQNTGSSMTHSFTNSTLTAPPFFPTTPINFRAQHQNFIPRVNSSLSPVSFPQPLNSGTFNTHSGWIPSFDNPLTKPLYQTQYKFPKMDFPRFDGKNVRGWISKAEKFFLLNPVMDSTTKVIYTALYLDEEADYWYQTIQAQYPGLG